MKPLWKPIPGAARQKTRELYERELAAAYELVDHRDGRCCYVTGRKLSHATSDPWRVLTHHHLISRALSKADRTEPSNIITLSLAVHRLVTAGVLHLLTAGGEKATSTATLDHAAWNRARVEPGSEPFALDRNLSRRRVD